MASGRRPGSAATRPPGGLHPVLPVRWDLSPAEAVALQRELRGNLRSCRLAGARLTRVAGCDVAIAGDRLAAAVLVFALPELEVIDAATAVVPATFPPGPET